MKCIKKQTKIAAFLLTGLLLSPALSAQAKGITQAPIITVDSRPSSTITPRADVIVNKYRIYNGKQQYRRWNETRGYWVDANWIDMPT